MVENEGFFASNGGNCGITTKRLISARLSENWIIYHTFRIQFSQLFHLKVSEKHNKIETKCRKNNTIYEFKNT